VAEEVAWRGLDDVPHVLPLRNVDGQGDGEHLDELWSKIGYPTAASRSWERKTAAATSGGQQARSSSPTRTEEDRRHLQRRFSACPSRR
jgi:hypothetical protein